MLYSPVSGAAKQYILTAFTGKVIVNGVEYKDAANPILNYNGKTYLPLAKIGDLTGVQYRWNAAKKQVEIGEASGGDVTVYVPTDNGIRDGRAVLEEEKEIKKFQEENRVTVDTKTGLKKVGKYEDGSDMYWFEVYDQKGELIKRISDNDDTVYMLAVSQRKESLPPTISQGWINGELLADIYFLRIIYEGNELVLKTSPFTTKQQEYLRLSVPEGWADLEIGETTSKNVRIKKYSKSVALH